LATLNASLAQSEGLPRAHLIPGDVAYQVGGNALRVGFELIDELCMPVMVKVSGSESGCRNGYALDASVRIGEQHADRIEAL
jgi:hypothetical protein